MDEKNIYLVIPTIRDLDFLSSWGTAFSNCHLLIVEDKDKKTVRIPHSNFKSITHLCWSDIRADFEADEWIFSRKNAGIRSYGFYKAYQAGAEVIITMDDDCFPIGDPKEFVKSHLDNLALLAPEKWFATYPDPRWMFTRGFPYDLRQTFPVKVSHGIWSGALDLDGQTELKLPRLLTEAAYPKIRQFVPKGYYYPMCSMNLAFSRDMVPLMFFPMMGFDEKGQSWGYDRFDDIWAGVISKKIMDHLDWVVVNGSPQINHQKRSIPQVNLEKEKRGLNANERLWKQIDKVELSNSSAASSLEELMEKVDLGSEPYWQRLKNAYKIWIRKFD